MGLVEAPAFLIVYAITYVFSFADQAQPLLPGESIEKSGQYCSKKYLNLCLWLAKNGLLLVRSPFNDLIMMLYILLGMLSGCGLGGVW